MSVVPDSTVRQTGPAIIREIVERHHSDASFLSQLRQRVVRSADWSLSNLGDFDERLEAHLDGVRVAGEPGWTICERDIEAGPGELFVASVMAIESGDRARMVRVLREPAKTPAAMQAAVAAFERVAPRFLQGIIRDMLASASPLGRQIGLMACVSHRVNPGNVLERLIDDPTEGVYEWAMRACGELGLVEHQAHLNAVVDRGRSEAWWRMKSLVMLGHRGVWLEQMVRMGTEPGAHRAEAFQFALQVVDLRTSRKMLQSLAGASNAVRWQLEGSAIVGDPEFIPWQIQAMANEQTARLAGQAFSVVTGIDLLLQRLDHLRPPGFQSGSNDDPDDPNVEMDPDDGLPWPDPEKVKDWWAKNSNRFTPGTRYFMGAPVTREHCIDVLKNGYQRQRILAAHYLCLLDPGTPLFNTSAPAWRQQRLLAEMK